MISRWPFLTINFFKYTIGFRSDLFTSATNISINLNVFETLSWDVSEILTLVPAWARALPLSIMRNERQQLTVMWPSIGLFSFQDLMTCPLSLIRSLIHSFRPFTWSLSEETSCLSKLLKDVETQFTCTRHYGGSSHATLSPSAMRTEIVHLIKASILLHTEVNSYIVFWASDGEIVGS